MVHGGSWLRRASVAATAAIAVLTGMTAVAPASSAAVQATIRSADGAVNVRPNASAHEASLDKLDTGTAISIECWVVGQAISGTVRTTDMWDKLADGRYVSDAYVDRTVSPDACGSAPATSEPSDAVASLPDGCKDEQLVLCASKADRKVWLVEGRTTVKIELDARFGDATGPDYATVEGASRIWAKVEHEVAHATGGAMPYTMYINFVPGSLPCPFWDSGAYRPVCHQGFHFSQNFADYGWGTPDNPLGSQGCVNLRDLDGARQLYKAVPEGTKVFIY